MGLGIQQMPIKCSLDEPRNLAHPGGGGKWCETLFSRLRGCPSGLTLAGQSANTGLSGASGLREAGDTAASGAVNRTAGPQAGSVTLVPSVKGADDASVSSSVKWSRETGKRQCQPGGLGVGPLPAAGQAPAQDGEVTVVPAPGEGGSGAGGEGRGHRLGP